MSCLCPCICNPASLQNESAGLVPFLLRRKEHRHKPASERSEHHRTAQETPRRRRNQGTSKHCLSGLKLCSFCMIGLYRDSRNGIQSAGRRMGRLAPAVCGCCEPGCAGCRAQGPAAQVSRRVHLHQR